MAESVGLSARPPDVLSKFSQLLQIKQQRENVRAAEAEAQMAAQNAAQRKALASYDWNKHIGQDGTLDLPSLNNPELRAAAGDQFLDVISHAIDQKEKQVQNKRTMLGLREDQVKAFGETLGPLISDKDVAEDPQKGIQKVNRALAQYADLYGDDVLPVIAAYSTTLQNLPKGKLPDALRIIQMQSMDVAQQKAAQAPQYFQRGGSAVNVNPMAGAGVPQEITTTMAPGADIVTDAAGRQFVLNPQTNTLQQVGQGRGGRGGSVSPTAAPSDRGFQQPDYQGQADDVTRFSTEVDATRKATDNVGLQRNQNADILRLSKTTNTGPGTAAWRNSKVGGVAGDDYQTLGKILEKAAISNMQAMGGPPSDGRLEAAAAANGSTKFNPGALQAVTKFNDATVSALDSYRRGMDLAVGTKNPKYTNLPEFKSAWSKNFDVDVFRYENAVRDGDQEEIEKLRREFSENRAHAKELQEKSRNLRKLAATGKL
jgi:hypothetical protein